MSDDTPKRTLQRSDYERIYRLLESGSTTREAVCDAFGIKAHTLYLRLKKDRPELYEKVRKMPTAKQVPVDAAISVEKVLIRNGEIVRREFSGLAAHDLTVLGNKARAEQKKAEADPRYEMQSVALPHAKDIKALAQVAVMTQGMGLAAGTTSQTTITHNTLNHANVMRVEGSGILALEIPQDAIVDVEAEVLAP